MKIHTRVVISMSTGEVLADDAYDYSGPLALCGGSGGGGGGSGEMSWPAYMESYHEAALGTGPGTSISDIIDAALASNPYSAFTAYDPDTDIDRIQTRLDALNNFNFDTRLTSERAVVTGSTLGSFSAFDTIRDSADGVASQVDLNSFAQDNAAIAAAVDAFTDQYDDQLDETVYPRFELGMRDMNAIMSSSYAVGRALIETGRGRDISKFAADARLANLAARNKFVAEAGLESAKLILQKNIAQHVQGGELAIRAAAAAMSAHQIKVDATKQIKALTIVAKREELEDQYKFDEAEAKWELEAFSYGSNVLAGISGGVANTGQKVNRAQSGISGALGGASMGLMAASLIPGVGPVGLALGGILGLGAGTAGGLLG